MRRSYFFHDPQLLAMRRSRNSKPVNDRATGWYLFLAALMSLVLLLASARA